MRNGTGNTYMRRARIYTRLMWTGRWSITAAHNGYNRDCFIFERPFLTICSGTETNGYCAKLFGSPSFYLTHLSSCISYGYRKIDLAILQLVLRKRIANVLCHPTRLTIQVAQHVLLVADICLSHDDYLDKLY